MKLKYSGSAKRLKNLSRFHMLFFREKQEIRRILEKKNLKWEWEWESVTTKFDELLVNWYSGKWESNWSDKSSKLEFDFFSGCHYFAVFRLFPRFHRFPKFTRSRI